MKRITLLLVAVAAIVLTVTIVGTSKFISDDEHSGHGQNSRSWQLTSPAQPLQPFEAKEPHRRD